MGHGTMYYWVTFILSLSLSLQAESYAELVVKTLSSSFSSNVPPRGDYQRKRVTLSEPGTYGMTLPTLNPSDQNSAVNVVYQVNTYM